MHRPLPRLPGLAALCLLSLPALAVEIDGRIAPGEWQDAEHIVDFRLVQPLTRAPALHPTEAWVLSTPEGLAIAFRSRQAAGVPRTRQKTRRDEEAKVDRVNLMVDFDGDGRSGYNFTLNLGGGIADATITAQGQFSGDWDGNWTHAVGEDGDAWTAEMLIPWYSAPMRRGDGATRTLGIYLDRVVGASGERMAWPAISFDQPQFLAQFKPIALPAYRQSLLAVTPYAVGVYDNVRGARHVDTGADLFWKPNGQFQLSATLNPDFGQVESDALVVDFSAEETFFSDKRPFFTENQGIFDFGLLLDNSQLIYTRRVGALADDGNGAGDIQGAVKLNGSLGATNYGLLLAEERDDAGRAFRALRLNHAFGTQTLGMLATQVQRPHLDRTGNVLGVDYRWQPGPRLGVTANVVGSAIDQHGHVSRDSAATALVQYEMAHGWRQQWSVMHYGDRFDINDFGYLSRNNFNYAHWEVGRRITALPANSPYASHNLSARITAMDNNDGLPLQRQLRLQLNSQRRDNGQVKAQLQIGSAGHDDLILRGNGVVRMGAGASLNLERDFGRRGRWGSKLQGKVTSGAGLPGSQGSSWTVHGDITYYLSDALNVSTHMLRTRDTRWLLWRGGNLLGDFGQERMELSSDLNWNINPRQELRIKLQALGLNATAKQAWRVQPDARAQRSAEPLADFSLRNLGFQIRYRYELAPLSDLYIVYGRGGYRLDDSAIDARDQLFDAFALRDDEQLLVKLSYRFAL